jgi:hypothetical protein
VIRRCGDAAMRRGGDAAGRRGGALRQSSVYLVLCARSLFLLLVVSFLHLLSVYRNRCWLLQVPSPVGIGVVGFSGHVGGLGHGGLGHGGLGLGGLGLCGLGLCGLGLCGLGLCGLGLCGLGLCGLGLCGLGLCGLGLSVGLDRSPPSVHIALCLLCFLVFFFPSSRQPTSLFQQGVVVGQRE